MTAGKRKEVKCEGRFSEFRNYLFGMPIEMILEGGRETVQMDDLSKLWDLISSDIYNYDTRDPYFASHYDPARKIPAEHPYSLVPLFPSPDYALAPNLVQLYALSLGVPFVLAEKLEGMARLPERFLLEEIHLEPKNIHFPNNATLHGYDIHTHFGIGTISLGGIAGGGIRSDAPHLLEIYRREDRGQRNLAVVIGFWVQGKDMILAQIQPCRNANFPKGVSLGIGAIVTAEHVARKLGFEKIQVYTAINHPHFKSDPSAWSRMGEEFRNSGDQTIGSLGGYIGDPVKDQTFTKVL